MVSGPVPAPFPGSADKPRVAEARTDHPEAPGRTATVLESNASAEEAEHHPGQRWDAAVDDLMSIALRNHV